MGIINDSFMLNNETAKKLYNDYAKDMPIIDYHCHLVPQMIASDYKFKDAYDLFLGGDHYKWRQMRSFGIDEEHITGDADRYEKWVGFAKVMPYLIGNPLYHWTALELKRYFDIDTPLTEDTAKEIWDKCNEMLQSDEFSAKNLILRSNVETICTTDDPADDLRYHIQLREEGFKTKVLPTFRPDKLVNIEKDDFLGYIAANGIDTYEGLISWLNERIEFFNSNGCRLSDHALEYVPFGIGDAKAVFDKKVSGKEISMEEADIFKTAVLKECARNFNRLGWTMQLHIGALRNNNKRMFERLGPDTGFDSINDLCIAEKLSKFLDNLECDDILPKTILYTLNPKDNYVLGTMLGNFQKAPTAGKIQFGSGWWFNDNRDGMEAQMQALANLGILGKFVGMLTDSRSFVSYPRHEYFRRILCNMLGDWVEKGEYPADFNALEKIVKGICYTNAKEYFNF
ncbi:MAG: glucuronate isomerase [Clostridia bacterium]|nr:glucuronate isomerase [Clostridia bacterium]